MKDDLDDQSITVYTVSIKYLGSNTMVVSEEQGTCTEQQDLGPPPFGRGPNSKCAMDQKRKEAKFF